jgi:hypothetical protein
VYTLLITMKSLQAQWHSQQNSPSITESADMWQNSEAATRTESVRPSNTSTFEFL